MPKYIRDQNDNVFIFPLNWKHADVAMRLGIKPKSAGSFSASYDGIVINNRSESLNLDTMPDDTKIIESQI